MLLQINNNVRGRCFGGKPSGGVPKIRLCRVAQENLCIKKEDGELLSADSVDEHKKQTEIEAKQQDLAERDGKGKGAGKGAWKSGVLPFNLAEITRKAAQRDSKKPILLSEQEMNIDV